jgi:hypothetical protein
MRRLVSPLAALLLGIVCVAWIDYDDKVVRKEPAFGKEFRGFALRLTTAEAEFEQDSGQSVRIELRNDTEATALVAPTEGDRDYGLLVILTDKGGDGTMVSQELLASLPANPVAAGTLTPKAATELASVRFDDLRLAGFKEFDNGLPRVDPQAGRVPGSSLVPQLYVMRAILFSAPRGKRPDFAVASDTWPILLRPKDGKRMTEDERQAKMKQWLARMAEGAYGGIGVSSQLAALGEVAVEPLLQMAEKRDPGKETVRESRIWAIVTLCNTGSPRAEEYILGRLREPVEFGDLAFLAWHSQAFHSQRVTDTLRRLAEDAACDRAMPWEAKHGASSRGHGRGMIEYVFKHFAGIGESITDATAEGLVRLGDEKLIAFGVVAWKPSSGDKAVRTLAPVFGRGPVHSNVKKALLACLARAAGPGGFPAYDREADVNRQWLAACRWLRGQQAIDGAALTTAWRWLVLDVPRDQEEVQAELIAALASLAEPGFPVQGTQPRLPEDWVAAWRWALQTSGIGKSEATAFCTRMMRTRDELPDPVRLGLLQELRRLIGPDFPLPEGQVDVDAAWTECGTWLVQKGYFRKAGE